MLNQDPDTAASRSDAQTLVVKAHYPFVTKLLIELFRCGSLPNVRSVDIEPVYGYAGRILYRNGQVRLFKGSSLGVNRLGAAEVAKDKGYTKHFLTLLGYATPPGKVFLLPHFVELIDRNLRRYGFGDYAVSTGMIEYIERSLGYPCYLKPNDGSQGRSVERCETRHEVLTALEGHAKQGALKVLVERAVPYPDYRVVVLGAEVISCYLRKPLTLEGDGVSDVASLLRQRQRRFTQEGRDTVLDLADPRIDKGLHRQGWNRDSVLASGQPWQVFQVANLSVGGDSEDVTDAIHPRWRELCVAVTAAMGLRLCGVDLACEDIRRPDCDYSILEINAAPGLDNYAATGPAQAARVRELYRRVFDEGTDR
ncbi:hypothetical protein [Thiocapsa sp.]|uniref:hypothetical protein n=1 Tax=Thiocapsa sp. TaxID=2024551 RepID=UPI0035931BBE